MEVVACGESDAAFLCLSKNKKLIHARAADKSELLHLSEFKKSLGICTCWFSHAAKLVGHKKTLASEEQNFFIISGVASKQIAAHHVHNEAFILFYQ